MHFALVIFLVNIHTPAQPDPLNAGQEHEATATHLAQLSFCTLSIFHPRQQLNQSPPGGYVSNDGHAFTCKIQL